MELLHRTSIISSNATKLIYSSEKMFKDRRRKWGLQKNIDKEHARAMARKHQERKRAGKDTTFVVRGRNYSIQALEQYWNRYKRSIEEVAAEKMPPTPRDLNCLTPPPRYVSAPDEMEYSYRLLRSVRDYCFGAFEAGVWTLDCKQYCVSTQRPKECSYPYPGNAPSNLAYFITADDFSEANSMLKTAVTVIQSSVTYQEPLLLSRLMSYLKWSYREDVSVQTTLSVHMKSQCSQVARVLGDHHPLSLIFRHLSTARFDTEELYSRLWHCLAESFVVLLGPLNPTTVNIVSTYNLQELLHRDSKAALRSQRKVVEGCKQLYRPGHSLILFARHCLTCCLMYLQQHEEGEAEALQAVVDFDILRSYRPYIYHYFHAVRALSVFERHNGKTDLAELHLREAIDACVAFYGWADEWVFSALKELKWLLAQSQKLEAVKEVEAWIARAADEQDRGKQWRKHTGEILDLRSAPNMLGQGP